MKEINNSDSKKYAILTTTDSFYRYKEAVKELIDQNLVENEDRYQEILLRKAEYEAQKREDLDQAEEVLYELTPQYRRLERALELSKEANDLLYRIEREFDAIERRYNMLIEQKTVFAGRAAARIRYILMECAVEEDRTVTLVNLLNQSGKQEEMLTKLAGRMGLTERYKVMTDRSLYRRREAERDAFAPQAVAAAETEETLDSFVLQPLYTSQEIAEFRRKNQKDGRFTVTKDTIQSVEDLEKLFFVWQEATEVADTDKEITVGKELESKDGYRFSELTVRDK